MNQFDIKGSCDKYVVKKDALLVFVNILFLGVSIRNKDSIRARNVVEYLKETNILHEMRGVQPPLEFTYKHDEAAPLITNLSKAEDIARCHITLLCQIVSELIKRGDVVKSQSNEAFFKDFVIISHLIYFERVQSTFSKPYIHTYPRGKHMIKQFQ